MSDIVKESGSYHASIPDWPEDQRPREKFLARGPASLSDAELLAILVRTGSGRVTAVDLATRLLQDCGGLREVMQQSATQMQRFPGLGAAKAITVLAAAEIARRLAQGGPILRRRVRGPKDVVDYFAPILKDLKQEVVKVVLLDANNQVLRDETVSTGSLTGSIVHPREVFRPAIREAAASVIIIHNHPSGNPEPSPEDIALTRRLCETGRTMGIPVHDHVIIAGDAYTSFQAAGLMPSVD